MDYLGETGTGQLAALLRPRSIAVVGASPQEGSFGRRLLDSIISWRYQGAVYPVNPKYGELAGRPCHPSLAACPARPDCAAFAISDDRIEAGLEAAAEAGVKAAVIFGRAYPDRRAERLAEIASANGLSLCGCNCMGFINFRDGLKVTGNPPGLGEGPQRLGFISQSGSSWSGMVGSRRDLPFSYAISAGQELVTGTDDYIRFLLAQPETGAIGCILETVRRPAGFVAALEEAAQRGVPIAVLKLGRTDQSRRFALAHTGALSGSDTAFDALCARHQVAVCRTLDELADTMELLASQRAPAAGAVGAVTDSGGERQLLVDLAAETGCELATLSTATQERLLGVLDPGMTAENPVDTYGDGRILLGECLEVISEDPAVSMAVMCTNLVHGRARYLKASVDAATRVLGATEKPVVVLANVPSAVSPEAASELRALGVPVLMGTRSGLLAIRHHSAYHRPSPRPEPLPAGELASWGPVLRRSAGPLDAAAALELAGAIGVPMAAGEFAKTRDEALAAAGRLGYPVVMKTAEPEVLHKTEAGGVITGLAGPSQLASGYDRLEKSCGPGVLIQEQVAGGVELLLGMVRDPQFGPVITLAAGGIFVEAAGDSASFLPPVDARVVTGLLEGLRISLLLHGVRGRPGVDMRLLAEVVEKFSSGCLHLSGELESLEVNPLIATADRVVGVDALAVARSRG